MPNELKPCPFCGHKAKLVYNEKTNCFGVFCSYCNANVDGYYVYFKHREGSFGIIKKMVIEAWNGRTNNAE